MGQGRRYREPIAASGTGPCPTAAVSGDTRVMTAPPVTGPGRSGPEIRAALAEHAPADVEVFEGEFHQALGEAAASFDTGAVDQVLTRWWRIAAVRMLQLEEDEADQVQRARVGDFTGLLEQGHDGAFRRLD